MGGRLRAEGLTVSDLSPNCLLSVSDLSEMGGAPSGSKQRRSRPLEWRRLPTGSGLRVMT